MVGLEVMDVMIRFIDLRGQIYCDEDLPKKEQKTSFAFFNTSNDTFMSFSGEQYFDTINDFVSSFCASDCYIRLDRLKDLIPKWVEEK